jgi:SAM-dependent methyltransferase
MSVFGAYSRYYNLLYKDKDYAGEANFIHGLIRKHCPDAKSILDLGCGTGRHDHLLAGKGYDVTGVDMSEEMLAAARSDLSTLNSQPSTLNFIQGDIRSVRLGKTFDVVVSLFHVMSYQIGNADLRSAFATAQAHVRPGGIFIFDCWYGPAVLTDRPAVRVKHLEDEAISVTRIAAPVIHPNENIVDVNYQVLIRNKADSTVEELRETHRMRYLFLPEIDLLLAAGRLKIIENMEWLTGKEPGFDTWGVCFVTRDEPLR